jgi:hypothetical protein
MTNESIVNVGQQGIGVAATGPLTMQAGVIHCLRLLPGDCDDDGDADLDDYGILNGCLSGPGGGLGPGCGCFDFDNDNDNDLADFSSFQQLLN